MDILPKAAIPQPAKFHRDQAMFELRERRVNPLSPAAIRRSLHSANGWHCNLSYGAGEERSRIIMLKHKSRQASWVKPLLMAIRRSHLYFGLLLAPWALLYGITGYLFNHPTHFAEVPLVSFGRETTQGVGLEQLPEATAVAKGVLAELNQRFEREAPLTIDESKGIAYEGEFFMATANSAAKTTSVLLYRNGSGGSVRTQVIEERATTNRKDASFAVTPLGSTPPGRRGRGPGGPTGPANDSVKKPSEEEQKNFNPKTEPVRLEHSPEQIVKDALPTLLERLKIDSDPSEFRITTVPELVFHVLEDGQDWTVRFNSLSGAVSAQLTSEIPATSVSWRRFLTRLHLTHGYPSQPTARWFWAIVVDVMAFVMVFWGVSGIVMWWQIKRTRPLGTVALCFSIFLAVLLTVGMSYSIR